METAHDIYHRIRCGSTGIKDGLRDGPRFTHAHDPLRDGAGHGSHGNRKFIGVLLIFAVVAALYVLQEGLKDPRRNRFKLGLHCILIITSVVPPELPMELSLAVTNSLQALDRDQVFFVPSLPHIQFAGAVDVCCFDKTGALTSDELTARRAFI